MLLLPFILSSLSLIRRSPIVFALSFPALSVSPYYCSSLLHKHIFLSLSVIMSLPLVSCASLSIILSDFPHNFALSSLTFIEMPLVIQKCLSKRKNLNPLSLPFSFPQSIFFSRLSAKVDGLCQAPSPTSPFFPVSFTSKAFDLELLFTVPIILPFIPVSPLP